MSMDELVVRLGPALDRTSSNISVRLGYRELGA